MPESTNEPLRPGKPLSLREAIARRPNFKDVQVGDLSFRVSRLGMQDKLNLATEIDSFSGLDEEHKKTEMIRFWVGVIARCLVDADGNAEFDCPDGHAFLAGLSVNELMTLQDAAFEINGLDSGDRDAELESAKND